MFFFSSYNIRHIKESINVPGVLKTGLAKKSTHSTTWQFKTIKNHSMQGPIKSLHLTPGRRLVMVPRSISTSLNLK